jgi:hypothetical protein
VIAHLNILVICAVLWLLGAIVVANAGAVFAEEGLHWSLPDDSGGYRMFDLSSG